ncbi:MAG: hypothetical protein OEZ44_01515 [Candidatus Bathyarchaeota archaeon]|nr:hypothetical protein [Candidatus Bathyarchaeota archaeon]
MKNIAKLLVTTSGLTFIILSLFFLGIGPFTRYGVVEGKVNIGPFCPVEPPSGCPPPPGTYTSRKIILQPSYGNGILVPLNETGYFQARVKVGTYEVNLTNCTFLGCENALPMTIVIKPNQVTKIVIEIDTGIR